MARAVRDDQTDDSRKAPFKLGVQPRAVTFGRQGDPLDRAVQQIPGGRTLRVLGAVQKRRQVVHDQAVALCQRGGIGNGRGLSFKLCQISLQLAPLLLQRRVLILHCRVVEAVCDGVGNPALLCVHLLELAHQLRFLAVCLFLHTAQAAAHGVDCFGDSLGRQQAFAQGLHYLLLDAFAADLQAVGASPLAPRAVASVVVPADHDEWGAALAADEEAREKMFASTGVIERVAMFVASHDGPHFGLPRFHPLPQLIVDDPEVRDVGGMPFGLILRAWLSGAG
nr:hypothetical protein [Caenispirillum bisanense]